MGLLDSIKDKASSAVKSVGSGISDAAKGAVDLAKRIDEAPAAIAKGASEALKGAKELGNDFRRDPGGTLKSVGKQALEGAKEVGKWSWKHKGEIGFWAGTTALMLAVPVTGGASGALAGGMMAARGAALAAKIGQAGRAGAAAVKVAKAGAGAVQSARGAFGGTRAAGAMARTGDAVHKGRVALGGTKVGRAMNAGQKPATHVANAAFGMYFGDTAVKYAKGEASHKDMALATLGVTPLGVGAYRAIKVKRAGAASEKAAKEITKVASTVADKAAVATDDVARVASAAPKVNAPQTAGAAAAARDDAVDTVNRVLDLRTKAIVTRRAADAKGAVSATRLHDELGDVVERARIAREHADAAVALAPTRNLTRSAQVARDRLDEAAVIAQHTKRRVGHLAAKQQRADDLAARAQAVEDKVADAGLKAYTVNGGVSAAQEHHRDGLTIGDGNLLKNLGWIVLGRTQSRVPA